jgi:hypothetical protein
MEVQSMEMCQVKRNQTLKQSTDTSIVCHG